MPSENARRKSLRCSPALSPDGDKESNVQQVEVSRDELLKAIRQEIMTMALDKNYTDKLWTLLLLEDALQSLYIRRE
jgi:hypothetical protein